MNWSSTLLLPTALITVPVMAAEGEECGLGNADIAETAEMNEECLALFVHRA